MAIANAQDLAFWMRPEQLEDLEARINMLYVDWYGKQMRGNRLIRLKQTLYPNSLRYTLYRFPQSQTLGMVRSVDGPALYTTRKGTLDHIAAHRE